MERNPNRELELASQEDRSVATTTGPLDVGSLLQGVIQKGVTADNVQAIEKLVGLYERMEARNAEREFAAAFLNLQSELPIIQGSRPIPDRNNRTKFFYANFEDLDAIVRPICLRHGFTYSFAEREIKDGRITVEMTLTHKGGHSRVSAYSVRAGSGPPGASESQADVSGHTYAQRGALEAGLSLRVVGRPDNAREEGGLITADEAFHLERRVKETNSNVATVLKLAGVTKFADVPRQKYEVLDQFLEMKERQGK